MERADVVVIGAGIVGLATARAVLQRRPGLRLVVLEKEDRVGVHQSGHNSGVIHSGIYYPPRSYKARLVRESRTELVAFCDRHGIPVNFCGKVIIATADDERARLHALHDRGREHGLDVTLLSPAQLREREPHAAGVAAIHVPEAGITDFSAVCTALAAEITELGGDIRVRRPVRALQETPHAVRVAAGPDVLEASRLVSCAGLHSDVLAPPSPSRDDAVRIVPFRGEYYDVSRAAAGFVRSLVYPVPDPRFPFLGVHLTRGVHGGVHAGPNAVLALAREGYRWRDVDLAHVAGLAKDPALRILARRYWRIGAGEIYRSMSKRAFVRALQALVPAIAGFDLTRAPAGVRAQAISRDGRLIDDFAFRETGRTVHVINAPSPAATASLGLGAHIAARLLAKA